MCLLNLWGNRLRKCKQIRKDNQIKLFKGFFFVTCSANGLLQTEAGQDEPLLLLSGTVIKTVENLFGTEKECNNCYKNRTRNNPMLSLAHHDPQADKVLCLPKSHGPTLEPGA